MIGGDIFMPANSGHVSKIRYNWLVGRHVPPSSTEWSLEWRDYYVTYL